jgi:hypothetical protein
MLFGNFCRPRASVGGLLEVAVRGVRGAWRMKNVVSADAVSSDHLLADRARP